MDLYTSLVDGGLSCTVVRPGIRVVRVQDETQMGRWFGVGYDLHIGL